MIFACTLAIVLVIGGVRLFAFNRPIVTFPMRYVAASVVAELCVALRTPDQIVRNWFSLLSALGLAGISAYLIARRRHWNEVAVIGASRESLLSVLTHLGWVEAPDDASGHKVITKDKSTISIGSADVPQFISFTPSSSMRAPELHDLMESVRARFGVPDARHCPKMAAALLWIIAALVVVLTQEAWVA